MTSSRFVVAVHVLTLLETEGGRPVTSAYIAGSVNTNPGVIRRLISMLAHAGMEITRLMTIGRAHVSTPVTQRSRMPTSACNETPEAITLQWPHPSCN